jgi:hypothetical protein
MLTLYIIAKILRYKIYVVETASVNDKKNSIKQPTTENVDFILYFLSNEDKLLWKSPDMFLYE